MIKHTVSDQSNTRLRAVRYLAASVLCLGLMAGCTGAQVSTVVKDIGIYAQQAEPILLAILPIITALSSSSEDAGTAASLNSFETVAKADLDALIVLCNEYTASSSTSTFGQIESLVDKLLEESDASVLQLAAIKDPGTRQRVQLGIASFDALIHTIDGFIQTTESATAVTAKARARVYKLQQVAAYWSTQDRTMIADAFHTKYDKLAQFETAAGL